MPTSRWIVVLLALLLGGLGEGLRSTPATAQERGTPLFGPPLLPDTVSVGAAVEGRLWSFADLPSERLRSQYDLQATEEWRAHARRGVVRLPGCSGGLVSERGLVLTTAHCVRSHLQGQSIPDSPGAEAFAASDPEQARRLAGAYAERVEHVTDVTDAVRSVREDTAEVDGRGALQQVEQRRQEEAPTERRVQVVREGSRYTAYTYRRYDDVRVVFLPERQIAHFGGADNAWAYPRHNWNAALLRIYEEDRPLETPEALSLRAQGARPGDAVFAVGFPDATRRVETAAQAAVRRDASLPARQQALKTWIDTLQSMSASERPEQTLIEAQETYTRLQILEEGLASPYVQRTLRQRDSLFVVRRASVDETRKERRVLINRVATLQEKKRAYADELTAFAPLIHPEYSSSALRRAWTVFQGGSETPSDSLRTRLRAIPDQPREVDAALFAAQLRHAASTLGQEDLFPNTSSGLQARVQEALDESPLRSADAVQKALDGDYSLMNDPLVELSRPLLDAYQSFRAEWDPLVRRENRLRAQLTRERASARATAVALPEDRTLRLADGRLRGYVDNGTVAPPFTTVYGLYGQQAAFRPAEAWRLPPSWEGPPEALVLSTPLVTAASIDPGGGMSGAMLLNESLQVVGVVTGGNVQSAVGEHLFLPDRMRAVSLDVRGLLEGLRSVYEANRLADELTGRDPAARSTTSSN